MSKKSNKKGKIKKDKKLEDIKRQQQQLPPEEKLFNIESFTKKSDEFASEEAKKRKERQVVKKWFINLSDTDIDFLFSKIIEKYESKFKKIWFYRLADLYKVDRQLMEPYVKPDFVRLFIIQFIYARFPRNVLRQLRGRNRKARKNGNNGAKLYHHLSKEASDQLDIVIREASDMMVECTTIQEFTNKYSSKYKVWFQTQMFS